MRKTLVRAVASFCVWVAACAATGSIIVGLIVLALGIYWTMEAK